MPGAGLLLSRRILVPHRLRIRNLELRARQNSAQSSAKSTDLMTATAPDLAEISKQIGGHVGHR